MSDFRRDRVLTETKSKDYTFAINTEDPVGCSPNGIPDIVADFVTEPPPLPMQASVEILEQPCRRIRFRYSRELKYRKKGSIRGIQSTEEYETFPRIKIIHNDLHNAIIVVSCVTKDAPYRVHPHGLFGPGTRDGVLVTGLTAPDNEIQFEGLGIHRATNTEKHQALLTRSEICLPGTNTVIDPFACGFRHANDLKNNDMRSVRLAFQVFVLDKWRRWDTLDPVVSDPIYNENVPSDLLEIDWVSKQSGSFAGDDTIAIVFDQKVDKNNIEVLFYELDAEQQLIWQRDGPIERVHVACVIIRTPPCGRSSDSIVTAYFQVRRLSDNGCSTPLEFQYLPSSSQALHPQAEDQEWQEPRNRARSRPMAVFRDPRLNQEAASSDENPRPSLDFSDEGEDKSVDSSDDELYHSDFSDQDETEDSPDKDDTDNSIESILESIALLFI